jgi:hypothetical protein
VIPYDRRSPTYEHGEHARLGWEDVVVEAVPHLCPLLRWNTWFDADTPEELRGGILDSPRFENRLAHCGWRPNRHGESVRHGRLGNFRLGDQFT